MAMWGKWRAPAGSDGSSEEPFLALAFPPPPPPLVRFVPFGGITWLWGWAEGQSGIFRVGWRQPMDIIWFCAEPLEIKTILCRDPIPKHWFCAELEFQHPILCREEIGLFTKSLFHISRLMGPQSSNTFCDACFPHKPSYPNAGVDCAELGSD